MWCPGSGSSPGALAGPRQEGEEVPPPCAAGGRRGAAGAGGGARAARCEGSARRKRRGGGSFPVMGNGVGIGMGMESGDTAPGHPRVQRARCEPAPSAAGLEHKQQQWLGAGPCSGTSIPARPAQPSSSQPWHKDSRDGLGRLRWERLDGKGPFHKKLPSFLVLEHRDRGSCEIASSFDWF